MKAEPLPQAPRVILTLNTTQKRIFYSCLQSDCRFDC
jgi:hypothetical protein